MKIKLVSKKYKSQISESNKKICISFQPYHIIWHQTTMKMEWSDNKMEKQIW